MFARISRRSLLKRAARSGVGLGALALIGCGGEEEPPSVETTQPTRTEPQQQVQEDEPAAQPVAVQQQTDQELQEQPQPAPAEAESEEPAAQAEQAQQTQQAQRVQQADQAQAQSGRRSQPQASPEPEARRLLIPEVNAEGYELEEPAFDPVAGARVDYGVIDGAGYRIELPVEWNGELLLWAHGFRGLNEDGDGFDPRLTFDDLPGREAIIGLGYGWATSTYRANGYVPGLGVDDLLKVKDRVAEIARRPSRTYCVGGSMGGATAQLMAQEFPREIQAAVAYCGALGNIAVVDYIAAWHLLAHWFIGEPPQQVNAQGVIEWSAPLGVQEGDELALSGLGEQFAAVIERFTGGPRWGFREGLAMQWEISFALGATLWPQLLANADPAPGQTLAVAASELPADTTHHRYEAAAASELGLDLDRLNAEVVRLEADPVRRADPGVGVSTGELRVPLLALKTTGDLFTPIHLDRDYQQQVQAAGFGDRLVVQAARRAGHCNFSESEAFGALTQMVTWLSFGLAPAGDDLSGDLQEVGVRFTDPFDADDPKAPAES